MTEDSSQQSHPVGGVVGYPAAADGERARAGGVADTGSTGTAGQSAAAEHDQQVAAAAARRVRALLAGFTQLGDRVSGLAADIQTVAARHTHLAAAVSEDLAPKVDALQQLVTEELGQLRGDVDTLLADRRSEDNTVNPPVDWTALTAGQAAEQWPILAAWIGEVLVPWCEWTRNELPDCWALHRPVVVELSWLRTTHVAAYLPKAPAHLAAEWHTRWRPASLTGIKELTKECQPTKHNPRNGQTLTLPSSREPGENLGAPATRSQPALPRYWWGFYVHAYHADLAHRRARAAAEELDWSPVTAGGG